MPGTIAAGHVVEVFHRLYIDPGIGHGHDHVGMTEAEAGDRLHHLIGLGDGLADQILAGDAEIDRPVAQFAGNLRGRQQQHFQSRRPGDAGAVAARILGRRHMDAGPGQRRDGLVLQPPLGGDREGERHAASPVRLAIRSSQSEKPTAGTGRSAPRMLNSRS